MNYDNMSYNKVFRAIDPNTLAILALLNRL